MKQELGRSCQLAVSSSQHRARVARNEPRGHGRGQLRGLASQPGDLDAGIDEETGAGARPAQVGQPPRESRDHPSPAEPGEVRGDRGIGVAPDNPRARLPHLVARRCRAHRAHLDGVIRIGQPHGMGEGILVGIVHPPLNRALVAIAPLEIRRADHLEAGRYLPGSASNLVLQPTAQK